MSFLKNLNELTAEDEQEHTFNIDISDDDEILNSSITQGEILKCIKMLKNNKSSANDDIINEHIKYTSNMMLPIYVSYFNIVFDSGFIPE